MTSHFILLFCTVFNVYYGGIWVIPGIALRVPAAGSCSCLGSRAAGLLLHARLWRGLCGGLLVIWDHSACSFHYIRNSLFFKNITFDPT